MDACGGWESVREAVRQRVGSSAFETWFRSLSGQIEDGVLVLRCPDRFSRDWIRSRYGELVGEAAPGISGVEYRVEPAASRDPDRRSRGMEGAAAPPNPRSEEPTFETFVAGASNALALEAARAVSRGEGLPISPLVLAGGPGVGKTHLCRAIRAASPEGTLYRSAEEFTSEVTGAMRAGRMDAIRYRYRRSLNVLILEDVQFVAGKRATQVELFHTLDHLISNGKRVVLSAERVPHELEGLDERLRSRIASGLVARIGAPDLETRRAILREKAASGGVRIPEDCLDLLSRRPVESVRDLLAGLNQVVARSTLLRQQVGIALVHEALSSVEVPGRPRSLDEILALVSRSCGVSPEEIRGRTRKRRVVRPRQLAMYLARHYTQSSLQEIGTLFGRDPASVRYAIDAVGRRIVEQPQLRYELEALASRFRSGTPDRNGAGRRSGTPRT